MNEISPSQQNSISPVRKSFVTGEELAARLSAALDRSFQGSGLSLESWLFDRVAATGLSKATVYRILKGEVVADWQTAFRLMDDQGPRVASEVLAAIGMKAVRHDDELAELRKRVTEQDMLLKNLWGLLKENREKREVA